VIDAVCPTGLAGPPGCDPAGADTRAAHLPNRVRPRWYYENWAIHVSNGPVDADRFTNGRPDYDMDERVNLYRVGATRSRRPGT
jgi:hypothetical protein